MTTQHTPGRLKVADDNSLGSIVAKDDTAIGHTFQVSAQDQLNGSPIRKANARRLVACWNRLEKFTTEQIEDAGYDLFADVRPDFERAMRQRDELLAALKRIEGATMSMYATRSDMLEDCQDIARAAIAKAEGGAK